MSGILDRIDNTIAGDVCPCGAEPRPGSAYCCDDCVPTHRGPDTDSVYAGVPTQMRWRPDLITEHDDSNLDQIGFFRRGRFDANVYRYTDRDALHLRLDDGCRFVGVDLTEGEASGDGMERAWVKLERQLTDSRLAEPVDDPWAHLNPGMALQVPPEHVRRLAESLNAAAAGWTAAFNNLAATFTATITTISDRNAELLFGGPITRRPSWLPPARPEVPLQEMAAVVAQAARIRGLRLPPACDGFQCDATEGVEAARRDSDGPLHELVVQAEARCASQARIRNLPGMDELRAWQRRYDWLLQDLVVSSMVVNPRSILSNINVT